jgi:hypothetical protein
MEIIDQIRAFVVKERWEYGFDLTPETKLRADLKIRGDEAVEFMEHFVSEFNVRVGVFSMDKYFLGETFTISDLFSNYPNMYDISLGDLELVIKERMLDDSMFKK